MPDRASKLQRAFGQAIRSQRIAKNFTQEALAEKSDLSLNFIGNLERGTQMASLESIVRVAEAMNIKPSSLLLEAGL